MNAIHQNVILGLLKYARPEILKEFRADSCIVSTAVGVDVLTHFCILAEAAPVQTLIFNKPFVKRIERGTPWPNRQQLVKWAREDRSYSVGIGVGTGQPGKWPGHLVIIAEKEVLIDLSLDQANRPNFGMRFDPVAVEVDKDFVAGTATKMFHYEECLIRIENKKHQGYLESPDWTMRQRRKPIVDRVIQLIKGDLK